jgi:hypothetical protein
MHFQATEHQNLYIASSELYVSVELGKKKRKTEWMMWRTEEHRRCLESNYDRSVFPASAYSLHQLG